MTRILVVEDEEKIARFVELELEHEGYEVDKAPDGRAGVELALSRDYDLVLLDILLPQLNGMEVLRRIRREKTTPVIMLTARGQVVDKVLGLKIGADDYLTKPFDMLELLARIEVQVRRTPASSTVPHVHTFGDVVVDTRKAEVTRGGTALDLSAREFLLLKYFLEHRGDTVTREQLLNDVWGYHAMPSTRTVDVHVAWLRQKIEPSPRHPQHLLTVHGLGYKFVG